MLHDEQPDYEDERALVFLAQMAKKDVDQALRKDIWPATTSLARVVETLAQRVVELTHDIRQLKPHDARAEDGRNDYGTYRGVCSCGWATGWDERSQIDGWVERHKARYETGDGGA